MPWQQTVFPLLIVTPSGGFTGLFLYSPAPGAGHLIASITSAAGTDPYGNTFPAGISSQSGGTEAILIGHELAWDAPADHPSSLPAVFAAPSAASGNSLEITTGSGNGGVTAGAITIYDSAASSTVPAIPAGQPGIFVPATCPIVCDTWHDMPAMANSWAIGGHAQYRLDPLGNLQVSFKDLVPPAGPVDGQTIWAAGSLPSSYQVANSHRVAAYTAIQRASGATSESAALEFETDGSIQCFGIAAASPRVDLFTTIPMV
jgi:hypothetical protein